MKVNGWFSMTFKDRIQALLSFLWMLKPFFLAETVENVNDEDAVVTEVTIFSYISFSSSDH